MLSFLNINSVPWIASGILLLGLLFYRGEYLHEKSLRAEDIAKANQALIDQKELDAKRAKEVQDKHAAELAKLKESYNGRLVSIMRADNSQACISSPPINALIDGLLRDKAGGIQGRPSP